MVWVSANLLFHSNILYLLFISYNIKHIAFYLNCYSNMMYSTYFAFNMSWTYHYIVLGWILSQKMKIGIIWWLNWWFDYVCVFASCFRCWRHYVSKLSVLQSPCPSITQMSNQPTCCLSIHISIQLSILKGFQIFSWEHIGGMALNFACLCILNTSRAD